MTQASPVTTAEICTSVAGQVMSCLAAVGVSVSAGRALEDGSYEFILGPVYLPHDQASLAALTEKRSLLVHLRFEDQRRAEPRRARWMIRAGDGEREVPQQPAQAIIIDSVEAPPDEDVFVVHYHVQAK